MKTIYVVSRCKKDDTLYGPMHLSAIEDGVTLCGQKVKGDAWWITGVLGHKLSGEPTCKKCLQVHLIHADDLAVTDTGYGKA